MHQGQAVRGGKPDDIIKATQSFVTRLLVTFGLKSKQNEVIDSDFVVRRVEWPPLQCISIMLEVR